MNKLKMKLIWKDFITYLPPIYGKLLLINFPTIIVIILYLLLKIILILLWPRLILLTPALNFLFSLIYSWLLLPYLQGVLVLYIYNHLQRGNLSISKTFKIALEKRWKLISVNISCVIQSFFCFLRFTIGSLFAFLILHIISRYLGIYILFDVTFSRNLMFFYFSIFSLIVIFYYIVFVFCSGFILIESREVFESLKLSKRLPKNNEYRILFGAFIIIITSLLLTLIASRISGMAGLIIVYLSYPLFWFYSTIVYKHLKLQTIKQSSSSPNSRIHSHRNRSSKSKIAIPNLGKFNFSSSSWMAILALVLIGVGTFGFLSMGNNNLNPSPQSNNLNISPQNNDLNPSPHKNNSALLFDGVDDYIEVKSSEVINQIGRGDFTFSAWVNALESEQARHPQILSNRTANGDGFLFGFHARWRGSKNKIPYVQLDNLNWVEYPNQPDLLNGQWHHFVARRRDDNLSYFADGEQVGSLSISRIKNHNIASDRALLIGWDLVNRYQTHFKGKIDNLSIWNRALSDTEIQSDLLGSLQGDEPGLLSYWSFDEGSGNLVKDESEHGNHGTIFGAVWTTGYSSKVD